MSLMARRNQDAAQMVKISFLCTQEEDFRLRRFSFTLPVSRCSWPLYTEVLFRLHTINADTQVKCKFLYSQCVRMWPSHNRIPCNGTCYG